MPDTVPRGRRVVEGRECMASDWGLESGRTCKDLQENGTSPPQIYRQDKYRNEKEVSELKMCLCFGFYTPMTNTLFIIPFFPSEAQFYFKLLQCSQTPKLPRPHSSWKAHDSLLANEM